LLNCNLSYTRNIFPTWMIYLAVWEKLVSKFLLICPNEKKIVHVRPCEKILTSWDKMVFDLSYAAKYQLLQENWLLLSNENKFWMGNEI
jgi:hypothetical protein